MTGGGAVLRTEVTGWHYLLLTDPAKTITYEKSLEEFTITTLGIRNPKSFSSIQYIAISCITPLKIKYKKECSCRS